MHIAYNGWFWDQPNTGSGQYTRRLLDNLRRVAPDLQMTLVLPSRIPSPDDLPPNVQVESAFGPNSNLGKVAFEQLGYPRAVARLRPGLPARRVRDGDGRAARVAARGARRRAGRPVRAAPQRTACTSR